MIIRRVASLGGALLLACTSVACTGNGASGAHAAPAPSGPAQDSGGGLIFPNNVLSQLNADCGAAHAPAGARDASSDTAARGADGPACTPTRTVSFTRDVVPIFGACGGEVCHASTWGSGDPYSFLVGVEATECCDGRLRVAPGDPSGSYLIQKLTGEHMCRGRQMPFDETPLPDAEIRTISDWICLGASHD